LTDAEFARASRSADLRADYATASRVDRFRHIPGFGGLTATIQPIRGRNVAIAVGETLSIGAWIEEPLGFFVYAVTPTRLHQIIEAILDAPR
jgi:hypothetical protein